MLVIVKHWSDWSCVFSKSKTRNLVMWFKTNWNFSSASFASAVPYSWFTFPSLAVLLQNYSTILSLLSAIQVKTSVYLCGLSYINSPSNFLQCLFHPLNEINKGWKSNGMKPSYRTFYLKSRSHRAIAWAGAWVASLGLTSRKKSNGFWTHSQVGCRPCSHSR